MKRFLADFGFTVLPLTENIGHRALVHVEKYGISSGMRAGDAIVAASAIENGIGVNESIFVLTEYRDCKILGLQFARSTHTENCFGPPCKQVILWNEPELALNALAADG